MKHLFTLIILLSSFVFAQTAGTVKWSYDVGDKVRALPAIAEDGTIYVCSFDGFLHALNADGTLKWKYEALFMGETSYIRYAPAIGTDGTIYFSGIAGTVYAVNPDGTEKWVTDITVGESEAAPAIAPDGTIIVTTSMGEVQALNPTDGSVIWNKSDFGNTSGYSSPAIDANGTIFLPLGNLRAISSDGIELWQAEASGGNSSVAIGADGTIYNGASDTYLYATNPDGTLKWKYETLNNNLEWKKVKCSNCENIFTIDFSNIGQFTLDGGAGSDSVTTNGGSIDLSNGNTHLSLNANNIETLDIQSIGLTGGDGNTAGDALEISDTDINTWTGATGSSSQLNLDITSAQASNIELNDAGTISTLSNTTTGNYSYTFSDSTVLNYTIA